MEGCVLTIEIAIWTVLFIVWALITGWAFWDELLNRG
jgi:hypothetical protein